MATTVKFGHSILAIYLVTSGNICAPYLEVGHRELGHRLHRRLAHLALWELEELPGLVQALVGHDNDHIVDHNLDPEIPNTLHS